MKTWGNGDKRVESRSPWGVELKSLLMDWMVEWGRRKNEKITSWCGQKQVYRRKSALRFGISCMRFGIKQPGPHLRIRRLLAGWPESACKAGDPGLIPGWERSPGERDRLPTPVFMGFHGGSDGNESTCSAGDLDSIPGLGRSPGEEHGKSLQYSCLENFHGQRCLVGYIPWDCKESDTMEQLNTAGWSPMGLLWVFCGSSVTA